MTELWPVVAVLVCGVLGTYLGEWLARKLLAVLALIGAWREDRQERLNQRKGEKHGF